MSRFATKEKGERSPITVNLAGGKAYAQNEKYELVNLVLTNLLKDQFYRSTEESLVRLRELLDRVDPVFAAKAAIYARNEFFMRSITHVMAAEIAMRVAGPPTQAREPSWIPSFIEKVVARGDDISEIAAYYMTHYGAMPTRLKKGLALALRNLDEYSLAKYNTQNRLLNVVRLVHPQPTEAITKLIYGNLKAPETWEVKLTQSGQGEGTAEEKQEAKSEAWAEMVTSGKIGYMALLRNLRNIAQSAPEVLDLALDRIADPAQVRKGKQFPIRYLTAANEIINSVDEPTARKIANRLEDALEASVSNVPKLDGDTVVFVDNSGSMYGYAVGTNNYAEIASIFGAAMAKRNNADIIVFSDTAKYVYYDPTNRTLQIAAAVMADQVPAGTYLGAAISAMKKRYDRIIIFSDMQTWMESNDNWGRSTRRDHQKLLTEYELEYKVKPYIYSIDLTGYGTTNWSQGRIVQVAGLSDKIFDLIAMVEQDRDVLIHEIEKIVI